MSACTRAAATRLWASARPAIVVTVSEAKGSVPREAGTRMLVTTDDAIGTIGGGHLELQAIAEARAMLAAIATSPRSAPLEPRTRHVALGPTLGQCCGGAVTLEHAPLDASALAQWPEPAPRFVLQLYGAGHVGRAIARALAPLDVRVDWIDEREDEFPRRFFDEGDAPWPAHIRRVCVDSVEAEVDVAPPGAYYLVLTHRHDLDLRIVERILARGDFGFCGLIGSKTKRARFVHRFEVRGLPSSAIARMTCPIGVAGIEGKGPEVIAAAVVAQLLLESSVIANGERHAGCRKAVPFAENDDGCEESPAPLVEARHRDE